MASESTSRYLTVLSNNRVILINGIKISIIVGTVLNLINQGDVVLAGQWDEIQWGKLLLTYIVPFCVSVYSALQVKPAVK